MAAIFELRGDEHVLDVACGTGHASLAVARRLPKGRVTAVDFSPAMLEEARRKAASLKADNVTFLEGDMQDLGFPHDHFDAAVCAFGIFFALDMDAQLARIVSAIRPGGRIMITNFQENYFHPLEELMGKRLASYGVQPPPQTWKRIATEAGCRELFEKAGLADIRVEKKNVGYYLNGVEQWWDIIWNAGFRRMVSQLNPEKQEEFKREHLQEVEELKTKDGIWLDVGVLYTSGRKAGNK
jgi:ubiquinone/menaquinone biosynthesis C-methylase UbiE